MNSKNLGSRQRMHPALGRALTAFRWMTRLAAGLVAGFFLMFLIGDSGSGGISMALSTKDLISLTAIVTMVAALLIGWFQEGLAAILLFVAYAVLAIAQASFVPAAPFLLFPLIGLMYGACSIVSARIGEARHVKRTRRSRLTGGRF